jgi:hypothetical protein
MRCPCKSELALRPRRRCGFLMDPADRAPSTGTTSLKRGGGRVFICGYTSRLAAWTHNEAAYRVIVNRVPRNVVHKSMGEINDLDEGRRNV